MFRLRPLPGPLPADSKVRDSSPDRSARRMRMKLWMLIIMLGLVIATMRQLSQPATVRRLNELFGVPAGDPDHQPQPAVDTLLFTDDAPSPGGSASADLSTDDLSTDDQNTEDNNKTPNEPETPFSLEDTISDSDPTYSDEELTYNLTKVQDNTLFRNDEAGAWFGLFHRLQRKSLEQITAESLGELTYAQLVKQPEVYRGQVVTIRGTLRREEVKRLAQNDLGIEVYHRLIIEPLGGGLWPVFVYCLELPTDFPRGDNLRTPVSVTGYFFKNQSYAYADGLGLAPILLIRTLDWKPTVVITQKTQVTRQNAIYMILAAVAIATLLAILVHRKTRRTKPRVGLSKNVTLPDADIPVASVHEQLQHLSETESQE